MSDVWAGVIGAAVGGTAGVTGGYLQARSAYRRWRSDTRRTAYLAFLNSANRTLLATRDLIQAWRSKDPSAITEQTRKMIDLSEKTHFTYPQVLLAGPEPTERACERALASIHHYVHEMKAGSFNLHQEDPRSTKQVEAGARVHSDMEEFVHLARSQCS